MNKFILSILLAFTLVFSAVSADMTASSVSISVEQSSTNTGTLTLQTSSLSVADVTYQIQGGVLTSTDLLSNLPASKISFNPPSVSSIANDSSRAITITVDATDIEAKTYEGIIQVSYNESGTVKTLNIALNVVVTPSNQNPISLPSNVDFGIVERSLDDEINNLSETITLTNTGSETMTGIVFSSNFPSEYRVGFQNVPSSLAAGASQTVTMSLIVPADVDAGLIESRTLTVASSLNSKTIPVRIEAENYLSIDDIEVTITHQDGDDESEDGLEDGDTVDEVVYPGDEVEIIIRVENNNNLDIDIDDVRVEIDNDEMDVNEDEKIDIREGDTEEFIFTFEVDEDAGNGDEDLKITISGTDDEGARHEFEVEITFEIEELEDTVAIRRVDFPSVVRCEDTVRLEVEIENIGTNDLDEAEIRVEFPQWDIIEYERDIELRDGEDDVAVFNIEVPEDFQGSSYLEVEAFYERGNNARTDSESFDFSVNCGTTNGNQNGNQDDDDDIVIIPGDDDQTGNNGGSTPTGGITAVGRESFFESTGYLVLLAALVVILIVVIVGLILTGRK